jgi:CheY-like chemotaxis protein
METDIKVLVIDDEAKALTLLKCSLEEYGFTVNTAVSGQEGIAQAQKLVPQVIILDVRMPEMDGWETCIKLKQNIVTKGIPVIFLTALSEKRNIERARTVGGALLLTKPIDPYELANKIKSISEERPAGGIPAA